VSAPCNQAGRQAEVRRGRAGAPGEGRETGGPQIRLLGTHTESGAPLEKAPEPQPGPFHCASPAAPGRTRALRARARPALRFPLARCAAPRACRGTAQGQRARSAGRLIALRPLRLGGRARFARGRALRCAFRSRDVPRPAHVGARHKGKEL